MPTPPARLRLLLASVGVLVVVPLSGLAGTPGTAVAAPSETPTPTADPTPSATPPRPTCLNPVTGCATGTPTPTETATAAPTPTATATPRPTRSRTATPTRSAAAARATADVPQDTGSTEDPVTGGLLVGTVSPATDSPAPAATPSTREAAADRTDDDPLTRAIVLVLGLGVLLGLAGGTGLYLTRHPHAH